MTTVENTPGQATNGDFSPDYEQPLSAVELKQQNIAHSWELVEQMSQDGRPGEEAFEELWHANYAEIMGYVRRITHSYELAEDIVQTTFMRLYEKRQTLVQRDQTKVAAFLAVVARNLVFDHYKSLAHRTTTPYGYIAADAEILYGQPPTLPETAVIEKDRNEQLKKATGQLTPDQQRCITLRYLAGLTVEETAEILGKSRGAVKTGRQYGIGMLRKILDTEFELDW